MPKIKTHKGLAKRVKITAGGKVKHAKPFKSHLMSTKNAKRCRQIFVAGVAWPCVNDTTPENGPARFRREIVGCQGHEME
ncbi:MAG TPA: 50S ribosomal protein L35 [Candidatus Avalokitesvara rifleensis]|uniref:50S ribosomal protein L35 n=1 Tax=Candidatus Avalokitesvara rifleensis TaxID=3367620 RepID=UPI0040264963